MPKDEKTLRELAMEKAKEAEKAPVKEKAPLKKAEIFEASVPK